MKLDLFTVFLFLVALWALADFIVNLHANFMFEEFEKTPLAFPCPRCKASRGQPCKGLHTEVHLIREKLALGDYR